MEEQHVRKDSEQDMGARAHAEPEEQKLQPEQMAEDVDEGNVGEADADEGEVFVPFAAKYENNENKNRVVGYRFAEDEPERLKHLLHWYEHSNEDMRKRCQSLSEELAQVKSALQL